MGFASHLGPWRLGTVKDTTGTTAGTIQNMGCTVVAQSAATTVADTTATNLFVLPAGSQIINFYVGSTDAIVTVTYACAGVASGGAATVTCEYVVRNSDGAQAPTAFQN